MSTPVCVSDLFEIHAERLGFTWCGGQGGKSRVISGDEISGEGHKVVGDDLSTIESWQQFRTDPSPRKSLVGHLNLIHPNRIQVLGGTEIAYLEQLRPISREDAIRQLLGNSPDCIVVAEGKMVPDQLLQACNSSDVPLLGSPFSSDRLVDDLHYYLSNLLAEVVTLHGVYMEVMSIGVLLTGESGVGKSELALELITRGHRLIADDAPEFSRIAPDIVNGTCPKALTDFLEVRGLGILNIRELFGAGALRSNKYLRLIIRLAKLDQAGLIELNRLEGSYHARNVLGLSFPEIILPVAAGRNLAVLVECAARNHILRMSGYNSVDAFMDKQRMIMAEHRDVVSEYGK